MRLKPGAVVEFIRNARTLMLALVTILGIVSTMTDGTVPPPTDELKKEVCR